MNLCKDLGIRYPEELSFCKPLEPGALKHNYVDQPKKKIVAVVEENGHTTTESVQPAADTNSYIPTHANNFNGSNGSLDMTSNGGQFSCTPMKQNRSNRNQSTPISSPTGTWKPANGHHKSFNDSSSSIGDYTENLASSPRIPNYDVKAKLCKPKSLVERARLNVGWLDSSLSIMEQGIRENMDLCLRFKYYTFFDLNPKYDQVRINQLYEQAKWQILNEEIDCTEEEMIMFASLQLQVVHQNDKDQPDSGIDSSSMGINADDDIDSALSELQLTLEGPDAGRESNDITNIPELKDYLRFFKPKKFTLKAYKRYWFTYKDLHLYLYKTRDDSHGAPTLAINLRGCEVTPEVILAQRKFNIKLEVPPEIGNGANTEMWIRCDNVSVL